MAIYKCAAQKTHLNGLSAFWLSIIKESLSAHGFLNTRESADPLRLTADYCDRGVSGKISITLFTVGDGTDMTVTVTAAPYYAGGAVS